MSLLNDQLLTNDVRIPARVAWLNETAWCVGREVARSGTLVSHLVKVAGAVEPRSIEYRLIEPAPTESPDRRDRAHHALARIVVSAETVRHQAVPPVVACALDRPPYGVILPWGECVPLHVWRTQQSDLSLSRLLWVARQLVEVVGACYEKHRAHLNLIPEHVLICPRDRVTVVGWSRSRWHGESWKPWELHAAAPCLFRAPELAGTGGDVNGSEDIYSLGALIHLMVSGDRAGQCRECASQGADARPLLTTVEPLCPNELSVLVNRMLAPTMAQRPSIWNVLDTLLGLEIDHLGDQRLIRGSSH